MIDPAPVAFHPYWLKHSYNRDIEVVAPVREDEINRIASDAATSAYNGLVDAFRARGYEIVTTPGPGVMRLSPAVADLYVNAPVRSTPYRTKSFTREPGDAVFRAAAYLTGAHPVSDVSFVSGIGTVSKEIAYGNNRADFSFIAGGVVPGVLIVKPDFPENHEDWPFFWGENEYVIPEGAAWIELVNAARSLSGGGAVPPGASAPPRGGDE